MPKYYNQQGRSIHAASCIQVAKQSREMGAAFDKEQLYRPHTSKINSVGQRCSDAGSDMHACKPICTTDTIMSILEPLGHLLYQLQAGCTATKDRLNCHSSLMKWQLSTPFPVRIERALYVCGKDAEYRSVEKEGGGGAILQTLVITSFPLSLSTSLL